MILKFLNKKKMIKILKNDIFKDRRFSGDCLSFVLKNSGKVVKSLGKTGLEYKFNNNGFDLYLPEEFFVNLILKCKSETKAVKELEKTIELIYGKNHYLLDKWDEFEITASLVEAGLTQEEWCREKWEDKKECFVNFARDFGVELKIIDEGFEVIDFSIE